MSITYSESVRLKLLGLGVTQVEIAQATGVSQTTVSRFLRGHGATVKTVELFDRYVAASSRLAKRTRKAA
jgi:transcriptional regulator with XRE-family HTH domain